MEVRQCRKCGELKPLTTEFYNQRSSGYWRWQCKECMKANTKRHYYNDPDKVKERGAKYKLQLSQAGGEMSDDEFQLLYYRQDGRCGYCDAELDGAWELDHKTPVSRGGNSAMSNMIFACRECNRDKHNKTAEEFIEWRRRLGRYVREDFW